MPLLEFDDIVLWIGHVKQSQLTRSSNVNGHQFTVIIATKLFYLCTFSVYIIHLKRDMCKARAIERFCVIFSVFRKGKDLQWKKELSDAQQKTIEESFKIIMKKLNYL